MSNRCTNPRPAVSLLSSHPVLGIRPQYHLPHSNTNTTYFSLIHPKIKKNYGFCFSVENILRKKCLNHSDKFSRQMCLNHQNCEHRVSKGHFCEKYTKKINLLLMQGRCESDCIYNIYIHILCCCATIQ